MAHKDITTKKILKHIVKDIAQYIFHLTLDEAEILETEYQRVEERRADLVINNQVLIPLRMMRYYTDIALSYPKIKEIVRFS